MPKKDRNVEFFCLVCLFYIIILPTVYVGFTLGLGFLQASLGITIYTFFSIPIPNKVSFSLNFPDCIIVIVMKSDFNNWIVILYTISQFSCKHLHMFFSLL